MTQAIWIATIALVVDKTVASARQQGQNAERADPKVPLAIKM